MNNTNVAIITRDTYNYNNNTVFFSLINNAFLGYYSRVVRKTQQWLDGYDPSFHKDDMISTRLGSKLINGLAKSVLGRGLVFEKGKTYHDDQNKTLDFASKWGEKSTLQDSVLSLIAYTLAFGTAALKLSRNSNGELYVSPIRLDNFYYSVDGQKKLTSFVTFIRAFQSTENKDENYFLVEKRYFELVKKPFEKEVNGKTVIYQETERKPVVVYKVFKYEGDVQNNTMPSSIDSEKSINYKMLPDYVKIALKRDYSAYMLDEPMLLPFSDTLGVELFFNEGGDITNPTLPVGRSLIFDCLADLMHYDMNKSYTIRDLYQSKGVVGVPKALSQSDLMDGTDGSDGKLKPLPQSAYSTLNIAGYELVPGLDPNTQKPIVTQFEMREIEHQAVCDDILKSIANTIGVSPRLLASYIAQGGTKTDDEVQSEDDNILQWIKNQRKTFITGLNNILEIVLNYEGIESNVNVRFASDGLLKQDKQLQSIEKRLAIGMIDIEDAIREYYPDLDECQLQEKIQKAKVRQQELTNKVNSDYEQLFKDI